MAKNIDFMGAVFPDVPSVKLPQQGGGLVAFDDTTDATATADKILQGYTAYANGQKLVGTASGGITPSGTYSITSNGTYDVTQYASADVNVSGGGGSGIGTLLVEKSLGHIQTASTTATEVGSVIIDNVGNYVALLVDVFADELSAGHHASTLSFCFISSNSVTNASNKWNAYYSGADFITKTATSAQGVYGSSLNTATGELKISAKYNSTYTNTIDADYTVRVYGLTINDLIP